MKIQSNILFAGLSLLLSSLIVISCEYNFEDPVLTIVKAPNIENIEKITLADDLDSLYIYSPIRVNFEIDVKSYELYDLRLIISNKEYEIEESNGDYYYDLYPEDFSNGFHQLKLEATTSTNSGSIADRYKVEVFSFERNVVLNIDLIPPSPVTIDSIYTADGTLKVKFQKPEKENYTQIRIRSSLTNDSSIPSFDWTMEKGEDLFIDTLFAGNDHTYRVDLIGYNYEVEGVEKSFEFPTFKHNAYFDPNQSKIIVEWEDMPLYNNAVEVRLNYLSFYNFLVMDNSMTGTTSKYYKAGFGDEVRFIFGIRSKSGSNPYNNRQDVSYRVPYYFYRGDKFDPYYQIDYSSTTDMLYLLRDGRIFRYDFESLEKIDSSAVYDVNNMAVSQDGNYIYLSKRSDSKLIKLNSSDLSLEQEIDIVQQIGFNFDNIDFTTVSNQNTFHFTAGTIGGAYEDATLVDLNTMTVLFQEDIQTAYLSPTGKYFIAQETLYEYNGVSLSEVRGVPDFGLQHNNNPLFTSDESHLVYNGDGRLKILDMNTLNFIGSEEYVNYRIVLDPIAKTIGKNYYSVKYRENDDLLETYDLDGNFITADTLSYRALVRQFNNKLFASTGYVR